MTDNIEFDGVSKTYRDVVAVHDVSLSIEPGTYHCLLGPNGSGKSTLVRLALGLTQPDEGTVVTPDAVVGCGFEQPSFFADLSVYENIDVFADIVGADNDWLDTVGEALGLTAVLDRPAGELSSGYARKLDLALALIRKPDFLFLDEALDTLDDISEERFLEFLDEYARAKQDRTVVVSTHYVPAFEPYLDRVTLMHDGDIAFDGPTEELDLDEGESVRSRYVATVAERDAE
jgi:ABC-type multidrug transport system ATPase subunit